MLNHFSFLCLFVHTMLLRVKQFTYENTYASIPNNTLLENILEVKAITHTMETSYSHSINADIY